MALSSASSPLFYLLKYHSPLAYIKTAYLGEKHVKSATYAHLRTVKVFCHLFLFFILFFHLLLLKTN